VTHADSLLGGLILRPPARDYQIVATPYCWLSVVTNGVLSTIGWATRMRSKGSLCSSGRRPSAITCDVLIASVGMPAWTTYFSHHGSGSWSKASFLPLFKTSSQRLATLTATSDSANTWRAGALSRAGSDSAQTSAWVSARTLTAPQPSRRLQRRSWAATRHHREALEGLGGRRRAAIRFCVRGPILPRAFRAGL
jgi:hypothetical protein